MVLSYKGRHVIDNWTDINYLQYQQVRSRYTEHAGAGYPKLLHWRRGWGGGGRVRFVQAQDQQVVTTRSPIIITECLLTRSMLIKMYVHAIYSWFCIGTILKFCTVHFHAVVFETFYSNKQIFYIAMSSSTIFPQWFKISQISDE